MPFELFTYRRTGDLGSALRGLPPVRGRMFIVAGSGDRALLARLLEGCAGGYRVRRWDELYRFFSEKLRVKSPRVQIDPPDHWLLLRAIVARFRESGGVLPPGALRRGFLNLLGTQIRELISEEVGPESLEGVYGADDAVGRAFVALYRAYLDALEERGLSDSAGVTTQTRLLLDLPGAAEVCRGLDLALVGFSSFTHSQLALLRALVGKGATVRVYAPESGLANVYGAAQQFGVAGVEISPREPFGALELVGGDPRQELETAARSLVLWEQGAGPLADCGPWPGWDGVAFFLPRARLAEAREVFSRYGLPCFWSFRLKVAETPLWQTAAACLDAAAGGWQTEPVLRLLSEPWLCSSLDAAGLRGKHPRGEEKWRAALSGESLAAFERCVAFAAAVEAGGRAVDLLGALRKFGSGVPLAVASQIRDDPRLDSRVALFSGALRELDRKILFVREVVRDLGEFGRQVLAGADARAYLSAWADGTTVGQVNSETGRMAVFAGSPPTLFSVPCWFIAGAERSQWPGSLKDSPLLDEPRRAALHESGELGLDRCHLPLLAEQREQREFLFRRLIACGSRLTVVCHSVQDARERPQEMTPFFEAAEHDGWIVLRAQKIVRGLDALLASPDEDALVPVEARRPDPGTEYALPPERTRPGRLDARSDSVSLSTIDDFAACPYYFAMSRVLKMPDPPRDGEYDHQRGGTAMHKLWERAWRAYDERGGAASLADLAMEMFDEAVEKEYPDLLRSPSLRRVRESLRFQAGRLAKCQQGLEGVLFPLRESMELEFRLPPLTVGGVTFKGRCDRLDRLRDGRFILWDYKAGRATSYQKALQLAAYALALEQEGGRCGGWGWLTLRDGEVSGLWDDDLCKALGQGSPQKMTKSGQMEAAAALMKDLAAAMETGEFLPDYKSDMCRSCGFAALCRRGEFSGEIDEEEGEDGNEGTE